MKRSFMEAFDDFEDYFDEPNKRSRTDQFAKKLLFKDIIMSPSPRVGVGIIWLGMDALHLLPIVQSAIGLAGFSDIAEGLLWLKTMSDGTQRAVKIREHDGFEARYSQTSLAYFNTIVIMQDTTAALIQPAVIHSVTDIAIDRDIGSKCSTMFLNTPSDNDGTAMNCDHVYTIESRGYNQFNETQRLLLDHMTNNFCAQSQYLIMTSSHHQHQLSMLIDTITADFYAGIDRRLSRLVFSNESPCDIDVLGPLTRLGLTGDVLLKWHQGDHINYLVYQDVVPSLLIWFHRGAYHADLFIRVHVVTPSGLEQIYRHPDNGHIKADLREVSNLLRLSRATQYYGFNFGWLKS